jgi:Flp pilus assembly protein TadD
VAGVTAAVFWPSVHGEFVDWDDVSNFVRNQEYRGLGPARLRWAGLLAAAVLGVLAWRTQEQIGIWQNSERLWRAAVAADPRCFRCQYNLGMVLAGRDDPGGAETALRSAIALRPRRPHPHEKLGLLLLREGRHGEAAEALGRAVALGLARAQPPLEQALVAARGARR